MLSFIATGAPEKPPRRSSLPPKHDLKVSPRYRMPLRTDITKVVLYIKKKENNATTHAWNLEEAALITNRLLLQLTPLTDLTKIHFQFIVFLKPNASPMKSKCQIKSVLGFGNFLIRNIILRVKGVVGDIIVAFTMCFRLRQFCKQKSRIWRKIRSRQSFLHSRKSVEEFNLNYLCYLIAYLHLSFAMN